jgi:hypothetical protein
MVLEKSTALYSTSPPQPKNDASKAETNIKDAWEA